MKNFLYVVGLVALLLFNYSNVYATGEVYFINQNRIEMTETEYNNLLGLGFTESQIDRMDYETFIDNKDIEGVLVAETTKYVKTTVSMRNGIKYQTNYEFPSRDALLLDMESQSFQPPVNSPNTSGNYYDGLSIDSYKVLTTKITNIYDTYMRYKLDVDWLSMPSERSYDIMGIGIEASKVEIYSSLGFREDWITTSEEYEHTLLCSPKEEDTGGSVIFKLPSASIRRLEAYLFFNVAKANPNQTIESIVAVGDYAHAITSVSGPDDVYDYYTVNHVGGIEVDVPYANSYVTSLHSSGHFVGEW